MRGERPDSLTAWEVLLPIVASDPSIPPGVLSELMGAFVADLAAGLGTPSGAAELVRKLLQGHQREVAEHASRLVEVYEHCDFAAKEPTPAGRAFADLIISEGCDQTGEARSVLETTARRVADEVSVGELGEFGRSLVETLSDRPECLSKLIVQAMRIQASKPGNDREPLGSTPRDVLEMMFAAAFRDTHDDLSERLLDAAFDDRHKPPFHAQVAILAYVATTRQEGRRKVLTRLHRLTLGAGNLSGLLPQVVRAIGNESRDFGIEALALCIECNDPTAFVEVLRVSSDPIVSAKAALERCRLLRATQGVLDKILRQLKRTGDPLSDGDFKTKVLQPLGWPFRTRGDDSGRHNEPRRPRVLWWPVTLLAALCITAGVLMNLFYEQHSWRSEGNEPARESPSSSEQSLQPETPSGATGMSKNAEVRPEDKTSELGSEIAGTDDQNGKTTGALERSATGGNPAEPGESHDDESAGVRREVGASNVGAVVGAGSTIPGAHRDEEASETGGSSPNDQEGERGAQLGGKGRADAAIGISDDLVPIEAGGFRMGSPEGELGRDDDEAQHSVTLRSFWIGRHEVTQAEYEAVKGNNPSGFAKVQGVSDPQRPVEQVSWLDAVRFCNELSKRRGLTQAYKISGEDVTWDRDADGYRLPTEAEWEYACRAGTRSAFYTGECTKKDRDDPALGRAGWYYSNSDRGPHPVGQQLRANMWGLYDMHGNVREWCWDWYDVYPEGSVESPRGPSSGSKRVIRGGGYKSQAQDCRSADRDKLDPMDDGKPDVGFRLARNAE